MKYIATVEPRQEAPAVAEGVGADDPAGVKIVELTRVAPGVFGSGSRRRIGVLVGIAVAVAGFGFVRYGPAALGGGDQSLIVTAPVDGATVTSDMVMTGGVVAVDATAGRAIGTVHATVSMGGLVLGSRDVNVRTIGPFEFRIPLFPPPFDAPVVLRMQAASPDGGGRLDVFRGFRLNIPSAVGFWDASPTGTVDADGRVQIRVRGYGPLSARTIDIAIRNARGQEVAAGSSRLAVDGDFPGALAGRILGLGSFDATLRLRSGSPDQLSLRATWRDAATGTRLHMETAMAPVAGGPAAATPGVRQPEHRTRPSAS